MMSAPDGPTEARDAGGVEADQVVGGWEGGVTKGRDVYERQDSVAEVVTGHHHCYSLQKSAD